MQIARGQMNRIQRPQWNPGMTRKLHRAGPFNNRSDVKLQRRPAMLLLRLRHAGLVPPPAARAGNDSLDHDHADPPAVLFRGCSQHRRRARRIQLGGPTRWEPPETNTLIL